MQNVKQEVAYYSANWAMKTVLLYKFVRLPIVNSLRNEMVETLNDFVKDAVEGQRI